MTAQELSAVIRGIAPVVREYVATTLHGLSDRLSAIEVRVAVPGPIGEKGLDGRPGEQGDRGEPGQPGVLGERGERGEPGPIGEKGLDGLLGLQGAIGLMGPPGERGEPGLHGKSGDPGERGSEGPPGPPGRDGRDGVSIQGPPGEKGLDGKLGDPGVNGRDGQDGRDGTLENIKCVRTGPRTTVFCFKNGDPIEGGEQHWDVPLYQGVFEPGLTYEACDMVTRGGSMWFAKQASARAPDEHGDGARDWVLCVKHGRDGKLGLEGQKGLDGKPGKDGKDLTQVDLATGRKW